MKTSRLIILVILTFVSLGVYAEYIYACTDIEDRKLYYNNRIQQNEDGTYNVWIKFENKEPDKNNVISEVTLFKYDKKNNKIKAIQSVKYDSSGNVISSIDSYSDKWFYITPDSSLEGVMIKVDQAISKK